MIETHAPTTVDHPQSSKKRLVIIQVNFIQ